MRRKTPRKTDRGGAASPVFATPVGALTAGRSVYLRALEIEDAPMLQRSQNDPQVRSTFFTNLPTDISAQETRIRSLSADRSTVLLAIATLDGHRAIGVTGFHRIDWIGRMATFSLVISDPAAWGKGFGGEAAELMIAYGFDVLNFHRIQLHVFAGNESAIKIYRKLGFQEEGRLREAMVQNGAYHDFLVMGLLEGEWRKKDRG